MGQVVGAKKQVAFQYLKKQVGKNILKVVSMKMMTTKRYG